MAVSSALGMELQVLKPPVSDRVVSFVVFGTGAIYNRGAVENARLVGDLLPGWEARFYVASDVRPGLVEELASMPHTCLVGYSALPRRAGHVIRFLAMADAAIVLVRDADSRLNPRDVAAVNAWLEDGRPFHAMHEDMHDPSQLYGGMWGARAAEGGAAAIPQLPGALDSYVAAGNSVEAYGDDMRFLSTFLVPHLGPHNTVRHVAEQLVGRVEGAAPFPATDYTGYVGQPVTCACSGDTFAGAGCDHVNRRIPGTLTSLLHSSPGLVGRIGAFLGSPS